jgi:hypothetical protein
MERASTATDQKTERPELQVVGLLVQAADADTVYRDLYLERACLHLAKVFPEAQYRQLLAGKSRIDALVHDTQAAVRLEDWAKVSELSAEADGLRRDMQTHAAATKLAASDIRRAAGSGGSILCGPHRAIARKGSDAGDAAWIADRGIRRAGEGRSRMFEPLFRAAGPFRSADCREWRREGGEERRGRDRSRRAAPSSTRGGRARRLHAAAELADAIVHASAARAQRSAAKAEQPDATGGIGQHAVSAEPFPSECLDRASQLALEHLCIKSRFAEVPDALHEFAAQYLWRPDAPTDELASEGAIRLRARLDELKVPQDRLTPFAEVAALFAIRPFINSGGCRYVPADPGEYVLLETFPEDQEPPAESELLRDLGLSRRRALSRIEIEQALRRHGSSVLQERLGLDPRAFRIVCVPYDVYNLVGEERGWGQQRLWTHVDGYGVRGGQLGALVAGDVRYGGLFDLTMLDPSGSAPRRSRPLLRRAPESSPNRQIRTSGRRGQRNDAKDARTDAFGKGLDRAALAGPIAALERR